MATYCKAEGCEAGDLDGVEGATMWERYATAEEIDAWLTSRDLPPGDWPVGSVKTLVTACINHRLSPDACTWPHGDNCSAPPTCDCYVAQESGPYVPPEN